jgi:hypothetical protein
MQWVAADEPSISDRAVWSALMHLAGADLRAGPTEYLHGEGDIHAWIDELGGGGVLDTDADSPDVRGRRRSGQRLPTMPQLPPLPSSLLGRFSEDIGLFRCEFSELSSWIHESIGESWSMTKSSASIRSQTRLFRLENPYSAVLLVSIGSGWTLLMRDGPLGGDPGLYPSRAARDLGVQAVRAAACDADDWPLHGCVFAMFDPSSSDPLFTLRTVSATEENRGRWRFDEFGDPLSFEMTERYSARRIRDRLTPEMVRSYLFALGVPTFTLDATYPVALLRRK